MRTTPSPAELYEEDFYAWTRDQARQLRRLKEVRLNVPLDIAHLAEEIADLGKERRDAIRSWVVQIVLHLLFLSYSTARQPRRGWENEISRGRIDIQTRITPTLRRDLERSRAGLYASALRSARARLEQHRETAAAGSLPAECPFTLDQILGDWWPDESPP